MNKLLKGFGNRLNQDVLTILKEQQSFQHLSKLLPEYFPYSYHTLSLPDIEAIINTIIYANSTNIIECGSGLSTLVIGKLLSKQKNAQILAIENDETWINLITRLLNDNMISNVTFRKSDLIQMQEEGKIGKWYNIPEILEKSDLVDAIIVDGPYAEKHHDPYSRYYSYQLIANRLKRGGFVYLDDVNRHAEKDFLNEWLKRTGLEIGKKTRWGRGQIFWKV